MQHVSKQVLNLDLDCLKHGKHFLLTRDPIKQLAAVGGGGGGGGGRGCLALFLTLPSSSPQWKRKTFPLTIEESGFPQLVQVWSRLKEMVGFERGGG